MTRTFSRHKIELTRIRETPQAKIQRTSVVPNVICNLAAQIHSATQIQLKTSSEQIQLMPLTKILLQMRIRSSTKLGNSLTHEILRCCASYQLRLPNDPQLDLNTSFGALEFPQASANMTLYSLKSTSSKYSRHSWLHCDRDNGQLVSPIHSRSLLVGKFIEPVTRSDTFRSVHGHSTLQKPKE